MPKHITSDRGFKHMEPVETQGGKVRVYESSNATEACIWLNVREEPEWATMQEVTLQLTLPQAEQLAKQLRWLVKNHYQNEPETLDA